MSPHPLSPRLFARAPPESRRSVRRSVRCSDLPRERPPNTYVVTSGPHGSAVPRNGLQGHRKPPPARPSR